MRILPLHDGSCPSCGASGDTSHVVRRGRPVQVPVPADAHGNVQPPEYACLYLRPFAKKFRAKARLKAVARAMRPFGRTAALNAGEDRAPVFMRIWSKINLESWLLHRLYNIATRRELRSLDIELIDVVDERWRDQFHRLAFRSALIVVDVSASSAGVRYETEFVRDLGLANRMVVVHNGSSNAMTSLMVEAGHLQSLGLTIPIVHYQWWALRRMTKEIRRIAESRRAEGRLSLQTATKASNPE